MKKMCWRKKAYIVRREQRMSNAAQKKWSLGTLSHAEVGTRGRT